MYLIDKEIKHRVKDLNIECEHWNQPFKDDIQIQPCSIDLRLDYIFWKSKKTVKSIDLIKSRLLDLSPRRFWKRILLQEGEYLNIKPGDFVLGRVYEKFSIPDDCAGKLEGKSSLARLGLGISISSDFINPGWRGHMPLELINHSKTTIKIYPFIPICQLMLIKLSGVPERLYGKQELQSKYMEDDGGPSYWWRDVRIKKLQEEFSKKNISINVQENIFTSIGVTDVDTIFRFEKFANKLKPNQHSNSDSMLEEFAKKEKQKQRLEDFFIRGAQVFFILWSGNSIRLLFSKEDITSGTIIFWSINFLLLILFIYSFWYDKKSFFTKVN